MKPIAECTTMAKNDKERRTAASDNREVSGPNAYYDILQFGGYIGSDPGTTGGIVKGTTALKIAAARDFADGQGILVLGAGPATPLSVPTGTHATPQGVTDGSTYNYCVVAEDYASGRTACSAAGRSMTSAATLGINSFALTSCDRVSGVVTCHTKATHKIVAGAQINIVAGSTGDTSFEGAFTTVTASGTTFTFNQIGAVDVSGTVTSGTAQVVAKNLVQWKIVPYSVLRSYIYRCTSACALPENSANYTLAGVVQAWTVHSRIWDSLSHHRTSAIATSLRRLPSAPPINGSQQRFSAVEEPVR
jgi:hypothetical protein